MVLLDQAQGALRERLELLCSVSPADWERGLDALIETARRHRFALRAPRVVLAGAVNAGKSTLFNALLGRERATVSDEPGTTRDALVETIELDGFTVELVDVAGERPCPRKEVPRRRSSARDSSSQPP